MGESCALVGATGGAGTTRTAVETGAMLARDGRDALVIDAAFATQGLSEYVSGRIAPDATALVTDATDAALSAAVHEPAAGDGLAGRLGLLPARAPFERLARAETAAAAGELEGRLAEAADRFDAVLVDVPPVASNAAVAAATATDRTALVCPASRHGRDALQRIRGRLRDLGTTVDAVVSVRGSVPAADVALPEAEPAVAAAPVAGDGEGDYARAVAALAGTLTGDPVDVAFGDRGALGRLGLGSGSG